MQARSAEFSTFALCGLLLSGSPSAQAGPQPTVRIAFAAAPVRSQLPALAELCEHHLPQAVGALPNGPFGLECKAGTLRQFATEVTLPDHVAAAGSCRFGDGPPLLWCTDRDGTEDWFVPAGFPVPAAWTALASQLDAAALDTPITLSAAVVTAHLAGALAEGDPRAELLQGVAAGCGDVTWIAWRNGPTLRVRGRSDGGLALPAALTLLAAAEPRALPRQSLRAFSSRDTHRGEAARQLLRGDAAQSIPVLRALLHADDDTAMTAIDALVRLMATDELSRIAAAASPDKPGTTLAALHAVRSMWPAATPLARQRTRGAIARSQSLELRSIDLASLTGERHPTLPAEPTLDGRGRALLWLSLTAFGLCGLWLRERHRGGELLA